MNLEIQLTPIEWESIELESIEWEFERHYSYGKFLWEIDAYDGAPCCAHPIQNL